MKASKEILCGALVERLNLYESMFVGHEGLGMLSTSAARTSEQSGSVESSGGNRFS